jgi:RNA polymerase sigma-70 factor (ECF subfamily)
MWTAYDVKRTRSAAPTNNGNGLKKEPTKTYADGTTNGLADFTGLVAQYGGLVYWLSHYMTGNSKDAEDVLQKTFLAVQSRLTDFKQNESAVMGLARIAVDESFAKLRNRDASQLLRLSLEAEADGAFARQEIMDWADGAEKRFAGEELRRIVHEGMQGLTPFACVVFLLRDVAHLKPEQIADLFRLSVPRVKSHLLRSRLQLREHLTKYFKSSFKEKTQTA